MHEWLEFVIELLGIFFNWPVVILFVVFLFRRKIEGVLGNLGKRLSSLSVGGARAEFKTDDKVSPALLQLVSITAQTSPVEDSEQQTDEDIGAVDESSLAEIVEIVEESAQIDDTALTEFDQELNRLSNSE